MQVQILLLTIPALMAIFCCAFVVLWWRKRSQDFILGYAYWFGAVALGLLLQTQVFEELGPMEVVIFHLLSSSALITLAWAVARRDSMRAPIFAYVLMTLATAAVLWFARVNGEQAILLMAQNFNGGLIFAMTAYTKWQAPSRQPADQILLFTLCTMAAYSMIRPSVTVLIQSQMSMEEYQNSAFLTINLAITAIVAMMLALALIATIVTDSLEQQRREATVDLLSGLSLRRAFEEQASEAIRKATQKDKPLSLIVGDLDHFKRINDGWGHATGDMVIAKFGELISSNIRTSDVAGRVGGEEFCILVWNCEIGSATLLAERLRKAAQRLGGTGDCSSLSITASFGVSQWKRGESYTALFERADAALYRAKGNGRNRVVADGNEAIEYLKTEEGLISLLG